MSSSSTPTVSVVVPTLNGAATIGAQLDALLAQACEPAFEIIVVDNGSTDATAQLVDKYSRQDARVRLVSEPARGLNRARNAGSDVARGHLVLLCDSDDVVAPGWIDAMSRAVTNGPLLGGTLDTAVLNDAPTRHRWGVGETIRSTSASAYDFLPAPYGANCGYQRSVWVELGGFDPQFTAGGDDFEFFWRAQLAGHELVTVDDAVVHYALRKDWRSIWRRQYRFGCANVHVFSVFRSAGLPRSSTPLAIRTWLWLVATTPLLVMPSRRSLWFRTAAKRCGRLVGSIRHRLVYL